MILKRIALLAFCAGTTAAMGQGGYPFCQILDRVDAPPWEIQASYTLDADVDEPGAGGFGILQAGGGGGLAYFRTDYGDFDLRGDYDFRFFTSGGGIDLPDVLGAFALKSVYVRRNAEGQALRLGLSPSIRSDLREATSEAIYFPISIEGVQSFTPDLSGVFGVAIFPGFDRLLDPRIGLRWAIDETLLLDLAYPESKLTFTPQEGLEIYAGVKVDTTSEWHLDEKTDSIMLDESRAFVGVNHPLSGEIRMMYQAGLAFARSVDFDKVRGEADVDNATYASVGIGGPL